jgi:hypothetical protein
VLVTQVKMADGHCRTVPKKIESINALEHLAFPMLTSPKHAGLVWPGAVQTLSEESKKLYKTVLRTGADLPNVLVSPPVPGSAGSKDGITRILEWVIEEHNAGRLEGVITTGAKGVFPKTEDALLVFPHEDYVLNRDAMFGARIPHR